MFLDDLYELMRELEELAKNPECMDKLHEIERMIVGDIIAENRHLRCQGCRNMTKALIAKMKSATVTIK